jgi:DNA-binding winged helix-turn-helix (wHTH) protein
VRSAAQYDAKPGGNCSGIPYDFAKDAPVIIRFGEFRLNPETRQLHRGDTALHLSPKAFDLLAILLERRPGVVGKEVLRDRLWGGTNVLDANLNNLVSEIRSALDDDPQQPRFLRTAHRVGYAFCGTATDEQGPSTTDRGPSFWLVWNDRTLMIERSTRSATSGLTRRACPAATRPFSWWTTA